MFSAESVKIKAKFYQKCLQSSDRYNAIIKIFSQDFDCRRTSQYTGKTGVSELHIFCTSYTDNEHAIFVAIYTPIKVLFIACYIYTQCMQVVALQHI